MMKPGNCPTRWPGWPSNARRWLTAAVLSLVALGLDAQPWQGSTGLEIKVSSRRGGAVSGARVELKYRDGRDGGGPAAVATDSRGTAVVLGLAPGTWQIEVRHPDFMSFVAVARLDTKAKPAITASFLEAGTGASVPIQVKLSRARGGRPSPPLPPQVAETPPPPAQPEAEQPAAETATGEATIEDRAAATPDAAAVAASEPVATGDPESPAGVTEPGPTPATAPTTPPVTTTEPQQEQATEAAEESTVKEVAVPVAPPPTSESIEAKMPSMPEPATPEPPGPGTASSETASSETASSETASPEAPPAEEAPSAAVTPPLETPAAVAVPESDLPEPRVPEPTVPEAGLPEPEMPEPEMPETELPKPELPETELPETELPSSGPAETELPTAEMAEAAAPTPPAAEEAAPVPEPAVEPQPAVEPRPVAPPQPEAAPPATAAVADHPLPPAEWRAASKRTCPECRPGEWAVTVRTPLSRGACPAGTADGLVSGLSELADEGAVELSALVGRVGGDDGVLRRVSGGGESGLTADLEKARALGCAPLGVVLPKGARFVGFQFEYEDSSGREPCLPDRPCDGDAVSFLGPPRIARGAAATIVHALAVRQDDGAGEALLTVYFRPPGSQWSP